MQAIETLKYEYPKVFAVLVGFIVILSTLIVFMALPDTPILRAIGVTGAQGKFSATTSGFYWTVRARMHQGDDVGSPQTVFGTLMELDDKGGVLVNVPAGNDWTKQRFTLANVQITDMYKATSEIGSLRGVDVKLDCYKDSQAVVWVRGAPLNLKLIESGFATPVKDPQSSIFDKAFATYYWRLANGTN